MKGLILAGGLATRLRPLSYTGPKQLICLANKPVLHYIVEDLKNSGINDIGIIVGYTEERINDVKNSLGDGEKWDVKITYIEQDAPRGLAHAVSIAEDFINGEDFVVYLGDNIIKSGIKKLVEEFKNQDNDVNLLLAENDTPEKFGVAYVKEDEIIDIEEKPQNPKSNLVITGVYIFKSSIFKYLNKVELGKGGELQLTDAIRMMVHSPEHKVCYHLIEDWWDDTGTAESVLRANHLLLEDLKRKVEGKVDPTAKLLGNIQVGKGSTIKENCVIRGPVIIGNNCQIGPDTYIGPYTSVGDETVIKKGDIESSVILKGTYIDLDKKIVDSLIGEKVKILSHKSLPKGYKLLLGKRSELKL
ncbi:MAG: glucose-1-phosphate thymidylyltransferase [Nanoarchaeota archaeon]|nr:glucose-1-phosphate thymidylyltransferase [Nanoarchaeota archaeon]MCG2718025.1 glucose-1-phosphate thymidylyltransferase [Nanoarchaeota archaeon]